jgi:hypothetical protein
VEAENLPFAKQSGSELLEMIRFLPPGVPNGEGREGDMPNLIFMAKEDDLRGAFARRLAKGGNRKGGSSESRPLVKSEFCQNPPNWLQLIGRILLTCSLCLSAIGQSVVFGV